MGILDAISSQFIEVIEWLDDSNDTLLYRFPVRGQEIKDGAQLTVRDSQVAVFLFQGQIADVFHPGLYTVDGGNTPILSKLGAWKFGFNSPIKAEVYFVNTKLFTDLKWGTPNPVMMRDTDFGMVRLRAFGIYTVRVSDPRAFIKEVAGTQARFATEDIEGQLKRTLVSGFSDALGESKIPALDLASNYEELSNQTRNRLSQEFNSFGLQLAKFIIENISLPPEVETAMDRRTSMGIIGDSDRYTQYQAADAMREAAQNPSGGAGMGAGLGAGFAMGNSMVTALKNATTGKEKLPAADCSNCGFENIASANFCIDCGTKLHAALGGLLCRKCGSQLQAGAKFCAECGTGVTPEKCSTCQAEVATGAKFCKDCGARVQ